MLVTCLSSENPRNTKLPRDCSPTCLSSLFLTLANETGDYAFSTADLKALETIMVLISHVATTLTERFTEGSDEAAVPQADIPSFAASPRASGCPG